MEIQTLNVVYFSPTGTTRKIAQRIAEGVDAKQVNLYDLTKPNARENTIKTAQNDMLIVSVPVYMGRVPALINEFLCNINAHNTPTACVVVYGNRTYGNALLELNDILTGAGCKVIAGGAFIGEHSFSSKELPIAESRPDSADLVLAENFGKKLNEKLHSIEELHEITLPGIYPYGGVTQLWSVDFLEVSDRCEQCGKCAEVCPMDAINPIDSREIDIDKCISCCACIKNCPNIARSMKDSKVKDASVRLYNNCKEKKEPELF